MNKYNNKNLYLDDLRIPDYSLGFEIVKNYEEFVRWIEDNGIPSLISFDHDLADLHYDPTTWRQGFEYHEKTGYDCAKWLVQYCEENKLELNNCKLYVHSSNEYGSMNICTYLNNYLKHVGLDSKCLRNKWKSTWTSVEEK